MSKLCWLLLIITTPILVQAGGISEERFRKTVAFLGSDRCEGRGTGSEGSRMAARYLTDRMAELGLKPMGDSNRYTQNILMRGSRARQESVFYLEGKQRKDYLNLGRDYLLYHMGDATFIPKPAPLVFVGYGIVAPEYDYNDYQNVRVEGAIVVFLEGEPYSEDPGFFDGQSPTTHGLPELKQRIAISRGALGSIAVPAPQAEAHWDHWMRAFSFEHVILPYSLSNHLSVLMHPKKAELMFEGARYTLPEIWKMALENRLRSFPLKMKAAFEGRFDQREFVSHNLLGLLEGKDPGLRDSYVIVSAHYDHLGIGPEVNGDNIYNGVVDNALGVAGVLEIAHFLKQNPPDRSVLFLLTTGEEKGLLGSHYYVENPVVPLYKTIAAVNVDGLGIIDTFKDVIGIGGELSTLGRELEQVAAGLDLSVSPIDPRFSNQDNFSRSDQLSFAQAGIPAIMIYEGFDYHHLGRERGSVAFLEWGQTIYHTPFDDLSQPINYNACIYHAKIIAHYVAHVAGLDEEPRWYTGNRYRRARLRSRAERR